MRLQIKSRSVFLYVPGWMQKYSAAWRGLQRGRIYPAKGRSRISAGLINPAPGQGKSLEAVNGERQMPIISPSIRRVGIWKNWLRRWQDLSWAGMGGKYADTAFGSF